jgi:hypothetical protein
LVAPEEKDAQSARGKVVFKWTYPQPLAEGQTFQVLIWKDTGIEHQGAAGFTRQTEQEIDLDGILPARGGPGNYRWSVVVVSKSTGDRLSPEASPWRLTYAGPQPTPEWTAEPTSPVVTVVLPTDTPFVLPTLFPTWTPRP